RRQRWQSQKGLPARDRVVRHDFSPRTILPVLEASTPLPLFGRSIPSHRASLIDRLQDSNRANNQLDADMFLAVVVLPRAALAATLDVETIFPGPANAANRLGLLTVAALPSLAHDDTEVCDALANRCSAPPRADVADEDYFVATNR